MTSETPTGVSQIAAQEFESHRRWLWGLCYRMTGSAADADDIVQESFVRALQRRPALAEHGWRAWLAKVATNLSIDVLRRRKRQEYIGPWLPSPIETGDESAPPAHEIASPEMSTEYRYDLMESVSMAFLLALERLSPRQRAVLLLRDVFDYSIKETAAALALSDANVKVVHHRAREAMKDYDARPVRPTAVHQARASEKLREFLEHIEHQDVAAVEAMLAADVRFMSDGGGEFAAALRPVRGANAVARLLIGINAKRGHVRVDMRLLNGEPAVVVESVGPTGWAPRFVFRADLNADGRFCDVHTIIATRKLSAVHWTD